LTVCDFGERESHAYLSHEMHPKLLHCRSASYQPILASWRPNRSSKGVLGSSWKLKSKSRRLWWKCQYWQHNWIKCHPWQIPAILV
jgi:hypothetical protein